ncbi:Disintegrin and metalloproteinase domain-containing protein B [Penicillium subrubescens]|uniref:Disintegrin and metalloproteinase domain-containing protein B n=1 Tax=Penicillium subrubescens TaxID=1316194 RepID=A0A1Q5UMJ8_9EURO|nr:Disintegrin and metalloproteinase domain-containing protein B [Penicillium subrubescens]KAJ5905613.1 Disintegrin and metalloproteinase domain-containing protein B [Penicillium subrubescens]OKP13715.1 Disintegrin and metalloproteinase domain-containing protein B [Penicillium subrubescens]
MRFPQSVLPVIGAVSALFTLVQARSQASEAIRRTTPIDNAVIRTEAHQIDHLSHFDLTFELHRDGQRIKLELEPNHDILADDAYVQYIGPDGLWEGEPIQRHEHKVFRGRALVGSGQGRWTPAGWARISVRKDGPEPLFEGAFSIDHNKHHIELQSTYLAKKRPIDTDIEHRRGDYMVVYRDTDMIQHHSELKRSLEDPTGCSANKLDYNADLTNSIFPFGVDQPDSQWGVMPLNSLFGLSKRQSNDVPGSGNTAGVNLRSTVGDTSGCPKTRKVALIGVATDCKMSDFFKSNSTPKDAAKDFVINMVNTASNLYEDSFNVSIGLRNLTVNDQPCPTTATAAAPWNIGCDGGNMTWRLNEFSKWRASNADSNAYWTLMTGCPTGQEVGVSWMGALCNSDVVTSSDGNSVSGANVVVGNQGSAWQIFAHETGHTFGAVHDCDTSACSDHLEVSSQCCPLTSTTCNANAKYIMNPYADPSMTTFSQCTIGNICSAIGRNSIKSTCLSDNRGVTTIIGSKCGNGIVETGEDCDCGGEENCASNACCDAKTCKFKNNAVCDDSNDSCCTSCQFTPANTVCRASTNACDIAETCSGNSSSCPSDTYKDDGSSCGSGLTCASGQCTSRDYQCRSVMGSLLSTNDTWACSSEMTMNPSCRLVCGTAERLQGYPPNTCFDTYQNFMDGTPCDSGGRCYGGQCKGSSVGGWIKDHKNLVIGIAVGVGSLIVLTVLFSLVQRCRAARVRRNMAKNARSAPVMGRYQGRRLSRGPPRGAPPPPGAPYGPPPGPPPGPPMNQWYGHPDSGYPNGGYPQAPPPRYA